MGQRNVFCTHQMPELESGRSSGDHQIDDHVASCDSFCVDHVHPLPSNLANSLDLGFHHDQSIYYGNQYNNFQNHHHVPNHDICHAALPNLYPHVFHPTCSRILPIPQNMGSVDRSFMNNTSVQFSVDGYYSRDNLYVDSIRGSHTRKNAGVLPGNYNHGNRSASLSLPSSYQLENSGLPEWDAAALTSSEYQGNGVDVLQTVEGPHRSLRISSGAFNHQSESAAVYPCNCLPQGINMALPFHPANSGWMVQPDNVGSSGWNSTHAINYMHRRCFSSGAVQLANIGVQEYPESSCGTSSAFLLHPASMPNFPYHAAPGFSMQIHSYGHHSQVPSPYQYPSSNMHRSNVDPSLNGPISNSMFPLYLPSAEMIFRPPACLPQPALDLSHGGLRILLPEDPAVTDLTRVYGVDNVVDQLEDLRLDIEQMSYEELLALEEQIGDVNTGLTEESVLKNLKTTIYDPLGKSTSQDSSLEVETCAVCQVEYVEEQERIGTLDCGHYYHADCIKRWLLVKNLCPICKEPALATCRRDG